MDSLVHDDLLFFPCFSSFSSHHASTVILLYVCPTIQVYTDKLGELLYISQAGEALKAPQCVY